MSTSKEMTKEQARATYDHIKDMIKRKKRYIKEGNQRDYEAVDHEIHESALSVEVKSGWHMPARDAQPHKYRIVKTAGGPHVEITGELDEHGTPKTARIEAWIHGESCIIDDTNGYILGYASSFYFKE